VLSLLTLPKITAIWNLLNPSALEGPPSRWNTWRAMGVLEWLLEED
jgi:hypothetical protein